MTTPTEEAGNNFSGEINFSGFNSDIDNINTSLYQLDSSINDFQVSNINSSNINELYTYITDNSNNFNSNINYIKTANTNIDNLYEELSGNVITNMIDDHEDIKNDMEIYQDKRQKLIKLIGEHDVLTTKLANAKSNNNYLFFMVWTIILVIVSFSVFVNIVDDKQEMSSLTKILFITLFAYITYLVIKNILNINM